MVLQAARRPQRGYILVVAIIPIRMPPLEAPMSEVAIKGVRQGLLLVLPDDSDCDEMLVLLDAKLAAATTLINGSKAQLDVGERSVTRERLEWLVGRLKAGYTLEVTALIGTDQSTREAAEAIGLSLTVAPPPMAPERTQPVTTPTPPEVP
jgi:septum formation inhibitor MinC